MLQFRYRRTPILTCLKKHDHSFFTCDHQMRNVIEAIETGLAIQPRYCYAPDTDVYSLVHLASGTTLTGDTTSTLISAALWLRRILPLFDWTLPQAAFKHNKGLAHETA